MMRSYSTRRKLGLSAAAGLGAERRSTAVMTSRHWSTNDVPGRDQFAYWREAVCEAVLNVATEYPEDGGFGGDIACAEYGDLRFAAFTSTPHEIVRRSTHIGRSRGEHFLISLQRRASAACRRTDATCELQPGDIGIVDGTRPFTRRLSRTGRPHGGGDPVRHAARPRALAAASVRSTGWRTDRRCMTCCASISSNWQARIAARSRKPSCWRRIMCNLVALLTSQRRGAPLCCTLLARQAEPRRHARLHAPASRRSRVCRRRLLADQLCVSVRTVHKRFEQAQLHVRPLAAGASGSMPAVARSAMRAMASHERVQIAFGWGFNDLSHFTKAFRARFGMPPGSIPRASSRADQ